MELDFENGVNNTKRAAFESLGDSFLEDVDLRELGHLINSESNQQVLKW